MSALRKPEPCACPYCGGPMAGQERVFDSLRLPRKKRIVLDTLRKAGGRWLHADRLQFAVWGNEIDGGPDDAAACLYAYVAKLRPVLRPLGYQIENSRHLGYRLVRSEAVR